MEVVKVGYSGSFRRSCVVLLNRNGVFRVGRGLAFFTAQRTQIFPRRLVSEKTRKTTYGVCTSSRDFG